MRCARPEHAGHLRHRVRRGVVLRDPELGGRHRRVVVLRRPHPRGEGQLAVAAVAEQEELRRAPRLVLAAEPRDEVEREVGPGRRSAPAVTSRCSDAGRHQHPLRAQTHAGIAGSDLVDCRPVAGGLLAVEQARLGQHQRAGADRTDQRTLRVLLAQPGHACRPAAARSSSSRRRARSPTITMSARFASAKVRSGAIGRPADVAERRRGPRRRCAARSGAARSASRSATPSPCRRRRRPRRGRSARPVDISGTATRQTEMRGAGRRAWSSRCTGWHIRTDSVESSLTPCACAIRAIEDTGIATAPQSETIHVRHHPPQGRSAPTLLGSRRRAAGLGLARAETLSPRKAGSCSTRYPTPPRGLVEAATFPLIEAIHGRRSRRFAKGATIPDGPLAFTSRQAPEPLDPLEQMLLLATVAGNTGWAEPVRASSRLCAEAAELHHRRRRAQLPVLGGLQHLRVLLHRRQRRLLPADARHDAGAVGRRDRPRAPGSTRTGRASSSSPTGG